MKWPVQSSQNLKELLLIQNFCRRLIKWFASVTLISWLACFLLTTLPIDSIPTYLWCGAVLPAFIGTLLTMQSLKEKILCEGQMAILMSSECEKQDSASSNSQNNLTTTGKNPPPSSTREFFFTINK